VKKLYLIVLAAFFLLGAGLLAILEIRPLPLLKLACKSPEWKKTLVIGHRGASLLAPENTLAAFDLALEIGADGIECDVLWTADDVPVILHHHDISDRVPPHQRPARVDRMTAAEAARLDVGSWFGESFRGEGIPTLEAGLAHLKGRVRRVYLHDKPDNVYLDGKSARITKFADVIRKSGLADLVVVMVESDALELWRELAPDIGLLQCWVGKPHQLRRVDMEKSYLGGIRHLGIYNSPNQLSGLGKWLEDRGLANLGYLFGFWPPREEVERYREKGCDYTVFTLNEELKMILYLKAGFNAIGTDDPALLLRLQDRTRN